MDDNVIISSTQQTVGMNAANVSLLKLGTLGQTIVGIVVTSVVIAATVATVILIGTGVGYQPPITRPDFVTVYKPDSLMIYPLSNDKDPKGSALKISKVTQPTFGQVTINTDQTSLTYKGNGEYAGMDGFEYTVTNDKLSSQGYVNVTVLNRAPECADFEFEVSRNSQDNSYNVFSIEQNGKQVSDVDNDELFLLDVTQPSVSGSAHFDNKTIYYTPAHGFSLTESLVYFVTDRNETCNGTLTFTLKNDAPVAQVDTFRLRKNLVHTLDLLANDYDVNGDTINITYIGFSRGITTLNRDATIVTYTAAPTTEPYYDSIEYQISDFEPLTSTSFATIEVYNTAPTALNQTFTFKKNSEENRGSLTFDDIDELDVVTASIIQQPKYGTIRLIESSGTTQVLYAGETWFDVKTYYYDFLYTPDKGNDRDDFIQFRVTDSYDESTGFIYFKIQNDAPIAKDDVAECSRNNKADIDVISNDADPNGDDLELALDGTITTTKGGKVTKVSAKVLRYTPPTGFVGVDTFDYTVRDVVMTASKSLTDVGSVSVTVFNEAPIPKDDVSTVTKKKSVTISVLDNDVEPNNDPMTITAVSASSPVGAAAITISGDKKKVVFQASSTIGSVGFEYTVSDDLGLSATAKVQVDIKNSIPVAVADSATTFWNRSVVISPLDNDVDDDGDVLRVLSFTDPTKGSVTLSGNKFLYVPIDGVVGTDSFTYFVTDEVDTSVSPATVTITITNSAPKVVADSGTVHWRSTDGVIIDVLANDSDSEQDPLYVKSFTTPTSGSASIITLPNGRTGIHYIPSQTIVGSATFKYVASDWNKWTEGTVTITITNAKPVAVNDIYSLHWRTGSASFNVFSNDNDANNDPFTISSSTAANPSTIGSAVVEDNVRGLMKFTVPATPKLGTATFTYFIKDIEQSVQPATVSVTVTNANKPSASDLSRPIHWRTLRDAGYTEFSPYSSVNDADGDTLTLTATQPTNGNGKVVVNTVSGYPSTLRFSNTTSWSKGKGVFTYTLSDSVSSATASVTVNVENNPPVAAAIAFELSPQYIKTGMNVDVLAKASDADAEDSPYLRIVSVLPAQNAKNNGTAEVKNNKIFYLPKDGHIGTDKFVYVISDGLETTTSTLDITVLYTSVSESEKYFQFHWNDIQSGVSLDLTEGITSATPLQLTTKQATPNPAGQVNKISDSNVTYVPLPKTIGDDVFAFGYTDGTTDSVITATVTMTNTPPTVLRLTLQRHWRVLIDSAYGGLDVVSPASDPNGDSVSLVSAVRSKGTGTVTPNTSTGKVVYVLADAVNGLRYVGSGDIQFTFTITDGVSQFTQLADVVVTNDPPLPVARSGSFHWSSYKNGRLFDLVQGASDPNEDTITLYSVGSVSPSNAVSSITIEGNNAKITGVPPASLIGGSFSFTFKVSDGASLAQQTATISITNEAPVAIALNERVHWRESAVEWNVAQATTDGDSITVKSITSSLGTITSGRVSSPSGTSKIVYNPTSSLGIEKLTYTLTDGIQDVVAVGTIEVYNNAPVAKTYTGGYHWRSVSSLTFSAKADATDDDVLDKSNLSIQTNFDGLNNGDAATVNAAGVITVTPGLTSKAAGKLTVKYYVTDGKAVSTGLIQLTFTNAPPIASDKNISLKRFYGVSRYTLTGDNSLMITPAIDSNSDPLTLTVVSGGQKKAGTQFDVDITIASEYSTSPQTVEFVYNDGIVNSQKATATIGFTNDAPVCQDAELVLMKGETKSITVQCNDGNNDPITISTPNPLPSQLTRDGNTFTFKAPTGTRVTHTVPFIGKDGVGASGSATLTVRVSSQLPISKDYTWNLLARRDSNSDSLAYQSVTGAYDPDGDALTFSVRSWNCQAGSTPVTTGISVSFNSAKQLVFTRPFTFSSGTCQVVVRSTDLDSDYVEKNVNIVITTQGLNAVGRSITVDHKEGTFFSLTDAQVMLNDNDPLGGTLIFTKFYTNSADCTSSTGFCGNTQPTNPSSGTWRFSQTSVECQTQRFRYEFTSAQDPAQKGYAILDVRFQKCTCVKPLDIVFVLDGSGSVGASNFNSMVSFVRDIVAPLDIGTGDTQVQVGIVLFDGGVDTRLALSGVRSTVNTAINNLKWPQGSTNIRSAVLRAEQLLLAGRGPEIPKMIITIFDGEPNVPCSCSNCNSAAHIGNAEKCKSTRYPSRTCSDCSSGNPLKCNPCGDVLTESLRINSRKPGHELGYWRIMSIGVGPFLSNKSARDLIGDLSYDSSLSLAVDWNQLNTIVETIQSQSCDLVDTSTPSKIFTETAEIQLYCGQIIGISQSTNNWFVQDTSSTIKLTDVDFNPSDNRGNLFQITNCGSFGTKLTYSSSYFSLWSLATQKYVTVASDGILYASSDSVPSVTFTFTVSSGNIKTWTNLRLYTSTGKYILSNAAKAYTSSSYTTLFVQSVSYNNIAYRVGLPAALAFKTPITNVAMEGAA